MISKMKNSKRSGYRFYCNAQLHNKNIIMKKQIDNENVTFTTFMFSGSFSHLVISYFQSPVDHESQYHCPFIFLFFVLSTNSLTKTFQMSLNHWDCIQIFLCKLCIKLV